MGQYQQWLYHREVAQHLQAQLDLLRQEMQRLQKQAAELEDSISYDENPILQALAAPSTPHPKIALLSEDMEAFIDMHAPTLPRLHAARLVHQSDETPEQEIRADDRMDYSIQRWSERWGRQMATIPQTPQTATDQQEQREDAAE
jgi:hypothetical protein